ncbi:CII family transcriptional regulator [Enterobacteriaceae bacterium LUAb1]
METANNSKPFTAPTEQEINRTQTDLLLAVSSVTGREFAKCVGCHESKISRTDWRFIAAVICTARMAWEVSPAGRIVEEVLRALSLTEKAADAGTFAA